MQNTGIMNRYMTLRYNVFSWRYNAKAVYKVLMVLGMACLTGLLAQVKVYLPWSPVPVTGQTFAVLMSGILLGAYWGGLSQLAYILIGIAGVPWFAGGKAGMTAFFGPTGGYLAGFILASLFLGYFVDRNERSRNFLPMLALMLFANFVLIYVPGVLQLGIWLNAVKGTKTGIASLLMMGVVPFVAGDIIKIVLASGITKGITPKEPYIKK